MNCVGCNIHPTASKRSVPWGTTSSGRETVRQSVVSVDVRSPGVTGGSPVPDAEIDKALPAEGTAVMPGQLPAAGQVSRSASARWSHVCSRSR
jgi:hypothetical protein